MFIHTTFSSLDLRLDCRTIYIVQFMPSWVAILLLQAGSAFDGSDDMRSYSTSSMSKESFHDTKGQSIVLSHQESETRIKKKRNCCKNS